MDNALQPYAPDADPATQAFTRLEQEMALLRRAVEHLAAEKAGIVIPDYGETLAEIAKRMSAIVRGQTALAGMPAMQITPDGMAARMEAAAAQARRDDRATLAEVTKAYAENLRALQSLIGAAATIDGHRRGRRLWAIGAFIAGCLLWAALPGFAARLLPTGWHLPERIAARTVREPTLWDAGARLIRADSPEAWEGLNHAAAMLRDNREAIVTCRQSAAKAKKPVRCAVMVWR